MNSLKQWLANALTTKHEKFVVTIVVIMIAVATIGFADATHLTISHYTGADLRCGVNGGCNAVTTSSYSQVFGIPVALGGAIYYGSVILLSVAYLDTKKKRFLQILTWMPIAGLLASVWFVYVQLFILYTICIYCMVSAGTSTTLFILSQLLRLKKD